MNDGGTIFSQLISFLPDREFRRCVARYRGDSRLSRYEMSQVSLNISLQVTVFRSVVSAENTFQ